MAMIRQQLFEYAQDEYGAAPDAPFPSAPSYRVLRCKVRGPRNMPPKLISGIGGLSHA